MFPRKLDALPHNRRRQRRPHFNDARADFALRPIPHPLRRPLGQDEPAPPHLANHRAVRVTMSGVYSTPLKRRATLAARRLVAMLISQHARYQRRRIYGDREVVRMTRIPAGNGYH